jgi:ubiquinol-cytochrome c reductase cytochrome b subunit
VVWIAALLSSQFVLFFQLTGHLLPWDTNAVATANVEGGFVGNLWGIGGFLKRLILGGSVAGANTLTRWYSLHVTVLPILSILLVGLPLLAYRLHQGAPDAARRTRPEGPPREQYYPNHMAREMLVALGLFVLVLVLAVSRAALLELEATAANLSNGYQALAEWYVLPMHALTLIPPFNKVAFEPIATVVLPGALFLILMALPFIDRNPSRRIANRPYALISGVVVLAGTISLYVFAFIRERPLAAKQIEMIAIARGERALVLDAKLVTRGKELYDKVTPACGACHAISGKGGSTGPDLTHAGIMHPDRDWQVEHLIRPESKVPGSTMPAYGSLAKPDEIRALAEYMLSLR